MKSTGVPNTELHDSNWLLQYVCSLDPSLVHCSTKRNSQPDLLFWRSDELSSFLRSTWSLVYPYAYASGCAVIEYGCMHVASKLESHIRGRLHECIFLKFVKLRMKFTSEFHMRYHVFSLIIMSLAHLQNSVQPTEHICNWRHPCALSLRPLFFVFHLSPCISMENFYKVCIYRPVCHMELLISLQLRT